MMAKINLFKNGLENFMAKRAIIIFLVLAAADMIFAGGARWLIFSGLFAGTFCAIARFCLNRWILQKVLLGNCLNSTFAFTLNQLVLLPLIALAYLINTRVMFSLVAGLLSIPAVVMINSITEAFGITKNNFKLGGD